MLLIYLNVSLCYFIVFTSLNYFYDILMLKKYCVLEFHLLQKYDSVFSLGLRRG